MFDRKSTALASFFVLALVGFSSQLVPANAEPANRPAAIVYAENTSPSGSVGMTSVPAGQRMADDGSAWRGAPTSHPVGACDLRCRTGFFGYR
jgi:hypothetical protein